MVPVVAVTTRPASPEDAAFAQSAHHAAYHDVVVRQFGAWDPARQDAFFRADWDWRSTDVVLADGTPCGYWVVERRPDDVHVRELVLKPEWHGRGIGTTLLRRVQTEAAGLGVPVRLGAFHHSRALGLYARLGFRELGRTASHVLLEWRPDDGAPSAQAPTA